MMRLVQGGLYTSNVLTDQGNTPSEDLMCVKFHQVKHMLEDLMFIYQAQL